jgi:hypothetical protein
MVSFACLTLATAFVAWAVYLSRDEMKASEVALLGYTELLLPAAILAALVCALAAWGRRADLAGRLAIASGLGYLAVLKAAGLALAPMLALAAVCIAVLRVRPLVPMPPILLLAHIAGTLAGFHVAFTIDRYLGGIAPLATLLRDLPGLAGG